MGEDLDAKKHSPDNSVRLVCEVGRDALSQMAASAQTYTPPPLPLKGWEDHSLKV